MRRASIVREYDIGAVLRAARSIPLSRVLKQCGCLFDRCLISQNYAELGSKLINLWVRQYGTDSYWGRKMSRNLFWLSDDQWARIEPQLPTDVRGWSGRTTGVSSAASCMCSRVAAVGAIAPKPMVRQRRSITASCAGRGAASGKTCSVSSPQMADQPIRR